MRARQKGITFIGWLFLLVPVAIVGYAGIRLAPLYLNHMKVVKAIDQTAKEYAGEDLINPAAIRSALYRRFDVDSILSPTVEELDLRREGEHWVLSAEYQEIAPLFANISLLLRFNTAATID
jgi:CBS-domain-containing membrane protein